MSCAAEAVARGNTMMRGSQPPQQPPPRPPTTAAAAPTPHSNPATTLTNRRSSPFSIPAPSHTQTAIATAVEDVDCSGASHAGTKRKAEHQDNERLSKRLSLLNLGMLVSQECPQLGLSAPLTFFSHREKRLEALRSRREPRLQCIRFCGGRGPRWFWHQPAATRPAIRLHWRRPRRRSDAARRFEAQGLHLQH